METYNNQHIVTYRTAAEELGRKLIKLYDVRMFPRGGKNFADQLFDSGMEAGAYLSTMADFDDRFIKREIAQKAYDSLNRTAFLVLIMKNAKYYRPDDTIEIEEYLNSLIKSVREVIIALKTKPAEPQPAPQPAPLPARQPQTHIVTTAPAPQQQSPQVIIMRDTQRPAPQQVVQQPVIQPIIPVPQPAPKREVKKDKEKPKEQPKKPVQPEEPFDDDPDGFNDPV